MKIPRGILAFLITGVVFVIIIVIAILMNGDSPSSSASDSSNSSQKIDISEAYDDSNWSIGKTSAPVVIVEFTDFQCPYCARFHNETFPTIKEKYVDTGEVRFIFRHFPIPNHEFAQTAAEATEAAGAQDKFWEMAEAIFKNQSRLSDDLFLELAEKVGIPDIDRFTSELESGKYASKVKADFDTADKLGVNSTPSFFINGIPLNGAQPFSEFDRIIKEELSSS